MTFAVTIADLRLELDRLLVEGAVSDLPVWIRICIGDDSHQALLMDDVRVDEHAAVLDGSSFDEDDLSSRDAATTIVDLRRELDHLLVEGASPDLPVWIRIRVDVDRQAVHLPDVAGQRA